MLSNERDVVRCLVTYTDWWQLVSSPFIDATTRARRGTFDGLHPGLLDTIEERSELSRRMALVDEKDRHVLFLTYVAHLPAREIAQMLNLSTRQCSRRKLRALRSIIELGKEDAVA